jgi:hypothetical protein
MKDNQVSKVESNATSNCRRQLLRNIWITVDAEESPNGRDNQNGDHPD